MCRGGHRQRECRGERTILTVLNSVCVDAREIGPGRTGLVRAVPDAERKVLAGAEARGAGLAIVTGVAAQARAYADHVVDACLLPHPSFSLSKREGEVGTM